MMLGTEYSRNFQRKFGSTLAKQPIKWKYYHEVYNMEFLGGFVGIKQDLDDLFIRPEIGWVVLETVIT